MTKKARKISNPRKPEIGMTESLFEPWGIHISEFYSEILRKLDIGSRKKEISESRKKKAQ